MGMGYLRFPPTPRAIEDIIAVRGTDICHRTVWHWQDRFGPPFAADISRQRTIRMSDFAAGKRLSNDR